MFTNASKACFLVMIIEMCIYLAYFKDIIFSSVILSVFVGMFTQSYNMMYKVYPKSTSEQVAQIYTWLEFCVYGTILLTISTFFFDLDRAFYLQGKAYKLKCQQKML